MQSKELAARLRDYANGGHTDKHGQKSPRWTGQKAFALFLADYLKRTDFSSQEKYDFWRIEPYLPQIAVDAFEELRTSKEEWVTPFREMYEEETGHEVPNITDLGASYLLDQGSAVQTTLGFMFRAILGGEYIESAVNAYANAQKYVLQQTFDKFLRLVYRRGLYELITKCTKRGMSGRFGKTDLRTYVLAGRLMFTFARSAADDERDIEEYSVSFVAEDDDPLAYSAGIQSVVADLRTALDMIEEVITQWPHDAAAQKKIFSASKKVSII